MCQYRAVLYNKSPKTRHKIWAFFPLREMSNKKPCSSSHHLQTWQFPSRHGIWEVPIKYHMSASLGSCRSAVFWYRPLVIFLNGHKIAKYPPKSSFCFFLTEKWMQHKYLLSESEQKKKRRGREWMTFWIWRQAFTAIEINSGWQSIFLDTFQRCMMKTVFGWSVSVSAVRKVMYHGKSCFW